MPSYRSPKQLLQDAFLLREAGYNIPEELVNYLEAKQNEHDDYVQVWSCSFCNWVYKSNIKLKAMSHLCDVSPKSERPLLLVWEVAT